MRAGNIVLQKHAHQILTHQVSAVIGAAKALQRTILQSDRLKFCQNRLAQLATGRMACEIASHDGGGSCQSDDDECDADGQSFHEGALHELLSVKTTVTLMLTFP